MKARMQRRSMHGGERFALRLDVRQLLGLLLLTSIGTLATARTGAPDPRLICDQVAQIAADATGVPVSVLQAITRTETGRKHDKGQFGPWPWTVNMEGKGVWFDDLDDARAFVFSNFKRGARSFDVGCFQINYRWHHQNFSSIDDMFDPEKNALYAARFLKSLHDETGSWTDAAGAYHSRTPKYADRYKKIFEKHRARAPGKIEIATATPQSANKPRENSYPLLQSGGGARLGSLVPVNASPAAGFFINLNGNGG